MGLENFIQISKCSIDKSSNNRECTVDKIYFDINKNKANSDDFKVKNTKNFSHQPAM